MLLGSDTIPFTGLLLSWTLTIILFWRALRTAPWRKLIDTRNSNAWLGLTVALLALWLISAGIHPGLELHLLGITFFNLLFGWQLTFISGVMILVGLTLNSDTASFSHLAVNLFTSVMIPLGISQFIARMAWRHLPRHFFVYIFINSFFAAALSIAFAIIGAYWVLSLSGSFSPDVLVHDFFIFAVMLIFPEALLNGVYTAIAVVYKPHWVWSFDDAEYLKGK
jgi:uncharacterized membrane protein